MIEGIVAGTPLWVWLLMVALLWLGLSASRDRVKAEWIFLVLPLLGILPIRALSGLGATLPVWALFGLAYALGAAIGSRVQRRWILGKSGGQVRLAGEWLTLVQIVTIFALNYARGVTAAVAPDVARGGGFAALFALVAGVAAGLFAGRALAVWRPPATAQVPISRAVK